jgi:hypothetical protein
MKKLTELAVAPQLIAVALDDEETIEEFGDSLEFYVYDRQPIEKFLKFAGKTADESNMGEIIEFAKEMILDENGVKVMVEDKLLPTGIMTKAITKVMETLGK